MKLRLLPLLAALGATLVLAAPAVPATILSGKFRTVIRGQAPPLNGSWTLTIDRLTRSTLTHNGKLAVKGTFSGANGKLAVVDISGPLACKGLQRAATYTYTLKNNLLTLTATFDRCAGRKAVLTAQPLKKVG
jgi:hypothetical protein